ncbi:unnamed protein product [Gulo gulo]|uniref:Uncharacterized protein n=1 Tax=Gulo gulo TaxID=48420 RepID=A0A9X9Q1Q3_GULGU|nr:unnamed protein product [Gulo gulo]
MENLGRRQERQGSEFRSISGKRIKEEETGVQRAARASHQSLFSKMKPVLSS